jgi:hypothetical protein
MSSVRFVLLIFVVISTEAMAFSQAATRPCDRIAQHSDLSEPACFTTREQINELSHDSYLQTKHRLTDKEQDSESSDDSPTERLITPGHRSGRDCIYANNAGNRVESIDQNSDATKCNDPKHGGTLVPGYVSEDHAAYNSNTGQFQAASYNGENISYVTFRAGAQTDGNGSCLRGCKGYLFASANAAWLSRMIVGGTLDQMMTFLVNQDIGLHGILGPSDPAIGMLILCGPLAFWKDRWAGPDGMAAPSGKGDWAAIVHDYNYDTNHVTVSMYFNPFISRTTAHAVIKSNNNLVRNAGGFQGVKMGLFFGTINAFQWVAHAF